MPSCVLGVLQDPFTLSTPFKDYSEQEVLLFLRFVYFPDDAVARTLAANVKLLPGVLSLAHALAADRLTNKIAAYMSGGFNLKVSYMHFFHQYI